MITQTKFHQDQRAHVLQVPIFQWGDMHFSQGDGEVSFCGAIEMSGFLELKYAFASRAVPVTSPLRISWPQI